MTNILTAMFQPIIDWLDAEIETAERRLKTMLSARELLIVESLNERVAHYTQPKPTDEDPVFASDEARLQREAADDQQQMRQWNEAEDRRVEQTIKTYQIPTAEVDNSELLGMPVVLSLRERILAIVEDGGPIRSHSIIEELLADDKQSKNRVYSTLYNLKAAGEIKRDTLGLYTINRANRKKD